MPPTFPSYRISSILKNTHVPLGPRRAVSHSQNVFFIESFIGEMAHATAKEFAHRSNFQQVLDVLVEKGDWGKPMPRVGHFRPSCRSHGRASSTANWPPRTDNARDQQAAGDRTANPSQEFRTPPGLSLLRHANPFHVRRRHRRRADGREPMARHHPISCRRATPQPRPASVITTAAGRADSTGAAAAVPAPNFFTLALLSLRRAVCPIRSKKFS